MINRVIRWSIENRFLVLLLTAAIVLGGVHAIRNTPVDAIPDLSDVQVIIKTTYPGQAPQVVEDQVTYPMTTAMLSVPKAVSVRGFSFFGDSYVYVIFEDGTDIYWARSRVQEYLSQVAAKLPNGAQAELGPDATGVGWVYIYSLVDKTGQHDLGELRALQDWFLRYELQSVEGVAEVATVGGMVKQYQVTVQPDRLRAHGLSMLAVKKAIQSARRETGASVIEMAEAEYMVRSHGYLSQLADLRQVLIHSDSNGVAVRLEDIADIQVGPQMRRGIAELDGKGETVGGIIVMRYGENAQETISRVKEKLRSLQKSLPEGVEVIPVYDRSTLIENAVQNLWQKLLEEFLVVAVVCALFLFHLRSSLVVVLSLPVGILAAMMVMHAQGINANIMSLGGIAIAIGAMVDGAIVLIENMHKHLANVPRQNGKLNAKEHWLAVRRATEEVGAPLFFSLLIITVSFLPVFTLQAQEGKMFAPLAYTKTYAMAAAAGLTITLAPVLLGFFVRGNIRPMEKQWVNRTLVGCYRPVLNVVLRFPKLTLAFALLIFLTSLWPVQRIGSEFMPELDEGSLMYMPTTYPGISIGKARELLQQTDKLIATVPEVKRVFGKIGRAETATDPAPLTMIETFIQLKPKQEWREGVTTETLKKELNRLVTLPGVTNAWVMPIKTRIDMLATGIKTPLGVKISGPNLETIQALGEKLEATLGALPGTRSVYSERVTGGRYIDIHLKREALARFNMSVDEAQEFISLAVGGANVGQTVEGLQRFPINLRYPQRYRDSPERLELLPIVTQSGSQLTLGDIATVNISQGPAVIKSENARPVGWTFVDIDNSDIGDYVARAKTLVERELRLPAGYSLTWAGQYEYMERAQARLSLVLPLTLGLIVVLLYLSFKRASDVLLILGSLPFAAVGSVWLMYWLGYNFSIASAVGIIALSGVAVETGILMLVYLHQAARRFEEQRGNSLPDQATALREAILDGASQRIRPVVMTTVASIVGLLPILAGGGVGAEVMQRLAAPMVGGMVSAFLLTLLVLPALYFLVLRRRF